MTTTTPELFELVTWGDVRPGDHVWHLLSICIVTGPPVDAAVSPDWKGVPLRNEKGEKHIAGRKLTSPVMRLIPPQDATASSEQNRVIDAAIREHVKNMARESDRFALEMSRINETYTRQARHTRLGHPEHMHPGELPCNSTCPGGPS